MSMISAQEVLQWLHEADNMWHLLYVMQSGTVAMQYAPFCKAYPEDSIWSFTSVAAIW